jgi:hypothetical protein
MGVRVPGSVKSEDVEECSIDLKAVVERVLIKEESRGRMFLGPVNLT